MERLHRHPWSMLARPVNNATYAAVTDQLTEKAQEILSQMSDEEKLSKVPENPIAKLGSPAHERLLLSEIKAGLVE